MRTIRFSGRRGGGSAQQGVSAQGYLPGSVCQARGVAAQRTVWPRGLSGQEGVWPGGVCLAIGDVFPQGVSACELYTSPPVDRQAPVKT